VDSNFSLYYPKTDVDNNFSLYYTKTESDNNLSNYIKNNTGGWILNFTEIFSDDWTNVTITESQVSDADWWDADGDIDANEISESKIDMDTSCGVGNHLYVDGDNFACEADDDTTYSAGANLSLDGTTFSLDATNVEIWLDTLYYNSEADLTTLLDDNYEPISAAHFDATTINITCFNEDCTWYANATDSCLYWESGGKDCSS